MKILCFGAGAIGSYIGGSLALAGNELVFIEQPAFVPLLEKNGIWIEDRDGKRHHVTNFRVYGSIEEPLKKPDFDLAIIAVKSFDTDSLLISLKNFRKSLPPFLSLQNGVENEGKLAAFLGKDSVIPVSVCTAISRQDQGTIKVEKLRGIAVADGLPLSGRIQAEFCKANLKPKLISDPIGMKWSKMISNLLANASSAILDMTPAEIFADPVSYKLEIRQLLETLRVMRAYGIRPVNIPGIPIRLLCMAVEHFPTRVVKPILQKSVGSGRGSKMPSFYIDLHAGKKQSEVEFLNGAVVRYAARKGIQVPVNRIYYQILKDLAAGNIALTSFYHNPEKLAKKVL